MKHDKTKQERKCILDDCTRVAARGDVYCARHRNEAEDEADYQEYCPGGSDFTGGGGRP